MILGSIDGIGVCRVERLFDHILSDYDHSVRAQCIPHPNQRFQYVSIEEKHQAPLDPDTPVFVVWLELLEWYVESNTDILNSRSNIYEALVLFNKVYLVKILLENISDSTNTRREF